MTTNAIDSLAGNTGTSVLSSQRASYGDNPFLQLLTTQLQNQTPLEPVDNESFMNQMASYTTMQEQRDLNTNLLKLLDYQGVLARVQGLSQGSTLLGKEVSYAGEGGTEARGKVESVFVAESGDVKLKLAGGKEIDLREVIGIAELNGESTTATASNTNTNTNTNSATA
jgi:flagellar basal-body rod modification protein FlgD